MKQVALILNTNKTFDRSVIRGIARYVHRHGDWSLYVEDDPLTKIPALQDWRGQGIIADLEDADVIRALRHVKIPVVGTGGADPTRPFPGVSGYVFTHNEAIARMAAEHLLDRGLRHYAYCGQPRSPRYPWSKQRGDAYARRVRQAGFNCFTFTGRRRSARQWEQALAEITTWLAELPKPVGILACNDARARHVLEATRRLNLRVPDDVAVLGVDNDELMCELADPPLSSVIQGTDRMGYEAAALLDKLMDGATPEPETLWPVIEPVGVATRRSTDLIAIDDKPVAETMTLIRADPARQSVARLCRTVGLSRTTLDKRFHAACGRSVHEELRRVRLHLAQQLLTTTELPLRDIADRAGYSSVQYLSMVFRREAGTTPAQYRQQTRGG